MFLHLLIFIVGTTVPISSNNIKLIDHVNQKYFTINYPPVLDDYIKPFIVGGEEAKPNAWPSQVLIELSYKTEYNFREYGIHTISFNERSCGGTLLNKTHILTAAHCIEKTVKYPKFYQIWNVDLVPNEYYPTYESIFTVYAGAQNVSFVGNSKIPIPNTVKVLNVKKIYIHPSYNAETKYNDIALLEITPQINQTPEIIYASLPEKSTSIPSIGTKGTVIGWGNLGELDGNSDVLMQVEITVLDMKNECKEYDGNQEKQICAGELDGGKDSCQGDSGGGFYVFDEKTKKWITVGIVSYGIGCARPGLPGVYTRVSAYKDWIDYLRV